MVKPDGTVISNAYDSAGRLASVTASRGSESDAIEYAYYEAWLDSLTRNGEAIQYFNDCFLPTDEWMQEHYLNRVYDDDFRIVGITLDNTYATAYGYDDDGALVFAGDLALNRDSATGFLTNTVVGSIADSRSFNGFGEIGGYAVTSSNSPLYSATYTRDALGRVASQTEMLGAATTEKVYDYDVRGRLTSVTTGGVVTEWYAYDLNGNRTNSMNGVAIYDAQDRMTAGVGMSFAYDLNGSQTNRIVNGQSTGIAYDLFGQLASVTLPDDRVVSYDRDALSRITAKRIDGIKVKGWIYKDALKPIAETDASGNIVSFFVYGTSALSPDYMVKDGTTYRFIRDVQGSVRLVVDSATGTIVQRLDYDSFGNVLTDTNPGFQPFGFQSGLYDPDTALVQFGARWYDASSGRWLSKDPILLEGGLNLYVFCGNDPVNFADPLGLCEEFVDTLVQIGRDSNHWRHGTDALQRIDAGAFLADYGMPEGFPRSMLGMPFAGSQYGSPPRDTAGLRSGLTAGGQGSAAYRHIAGAASSVLQGMTVLSEIQDWSDRRQPITQRHPAAEQAAELLGNEVGRQVGREMSRYINDQITEAELRTQLMNLLGH